MRVGSYLRLIRLADNLSLRKFAAHLDIPSSTLSALEQGWVPPTTITINALFKHLETIKPPAFHSIKSYMSKQLLWEYSLRLTGDSLLASLCLNASGVVSSFLDRDLQEYDTPTSIWRLEREVVTLKRLFFEDKSLPHSLTAESQVKLLSWLLADEGAFVKVQDTSRFSLTKPSKRTKGWLQFMGPVPARQPKTIKGILALLDKTDLLYVPDPFLALDIILTVCTRLEINPLNPGEVVSYVLSHSGNTMRVEAFHPLSSDLPGVEPQRSFIRVTRPTPIQPWMQP